MKTIYMSAANILNAIRWVARVITLFLIILVLAFFFGEGGSMKFSTSRLNETVMMVSVLAALAGLVIAWLWEGFGALLAMGGLLTFSAVDFYSSGGVLWNVWVIGIPAGLFLFCWWSTNYSRSYKIYRS